MISDYILSLITAIGTLGATIVALFIVIIPSIWNKRKKRNISLTKIKNNLWILQELLRSYFLYNPTKMIIEPNEISYSYNLSNMNLPIKINEMESIKILYDSLSDIKRSDSEKLLNILNKLEIIFSGFPQHNTYWISADNELTKIRIDLFNDRNINMKQSVEQIFKVSIGKEE